MLGCGSVKGHEKTAVNRCGFFVPEQARLKPLTLYTLLCVLIYTMALKVASIGTLGAERCKVHTKVSLINQTSIDVA